MDLLIHHGSLGVIFTLSPAFLQSINDYGFFTIVSGTSFDASLVMVAIFRTFQIDWARNGVHHAFLLWDWDSTEVFRLSTITHAVCWKGPYEIAALHAEPIEWPQRPHETIGESQTNAQDYFWTLVAYILDNIPSSMEDIVPSANDGNVAKQLLDYALVWRKLLVLPLNRLLERMKLSTPWAWSVEVPVLRYRELGRR